MCDLLDLLRAEVVAVEIEVVLSIAVRRKIDLVSMPHGKRIGVFSVRHIFAAVIFQIVERDGLSQSSGITLPRPEVAKDHVVSDAIPIRRVGEQTALVHRQGLRQTTIYADTEFTFHPTV